MEDSTEWDGTGLDKNNVSHNFIIMMECNSKPNLVLSTADLNAIADTGTTWHYLTLDTPCYNTQSTKDPISMCMPNEEILKYTHISLLKETKLPLKTRVDHLFSWNK